MGVDVIGVIIGIVMGCVATAAALIYLRRESPQNDELLQYRALFDRTNDAVFIISTEGIILAVNRRACDLLGYSPEELVGQRTTRFMRPEEERNSTVRLKAILDDGAVPLYERVFIHKDGHEIYTEVNAALVRNPDGTPHHVQSIVRDISERKRIESALRASEATYRTVINVLREGIIVYDGGGNVITCNIAATRILGLTSEQIMVKAPRPQGWQTLREDGTPFPPSEYPAMITLKNGEPQRDVVMRVVKSDNAEVWININTQPMYDEKANLDGVAVSFSDITETRAQTRALRQRAEQLSILQQIDEEIVGKLSIDHVLMVALDAALRLSNAQAGFVALTEGEEVIVRKYVGPYKRNIIGTVLRPDLGVVGRILINQEPELVRDVHSDPDYYADLPQTRALMGFPLIGRQYQFAGLLLLESFLDDNFNQEVFDFIKLLANRIAIALENAQLYDQLNHQLKETRALYEQVSGLEQLKTDMIRIASHDLRNPLGVLIGYITLLELEAERLPPEAKDYIAAMQRSANRMNNILEDILSLERIEQMARETGGKPFDLYAIVEKAADEYRPQAERKGQRFALCLPTHKPVNVHGDSSQIYEAVTNLISNAIKYTPEGGAIEVDLAVNELKTRFTVRDNGYGIPQAQQQKLFQPFFRAKTEETKLIEGTGLGLHLVKNIIERHRGHMIFESVYGQGSTFGFELPLTTTRDASV